MTQQATRPASAFATPLRLISPQDLIPTILSHTHPDVTVSLDGDRLTVTSDTGARTSAPLRQVARDLTLSRPAPDEVDLAFDRWVTAHRPVTEQDMLHRSYWALAWDDPETLIVRWELVIAREHGIVLTAPDLLAGPATRQQWRHAAATRSQNLPRTARRHGAVTVLDATPAALSTGVLLNAHPERAEATTEDGYAVAVSPGSPVAVGPRSAIERLARFASTPTRALSPLEIPPPPVTPRDTCTRLTDLAQMEEAS